MTFEGIIFIFIAVDFAGKFGTYVSDNKKEQEQIRTLNCHDISVRMLTLIVAIDWKSLKDLGHVAK
jgi:hypothetical protein